MPPDLQSLHDATWKALQFDAVLRENRRGVYLRVLEHHIVRKYGHFFE